MFVLWSRTLLQAFRRVFPYQVVGLINPTMVFCKLEFTNPSTDNPPLKSLTVLPNYTWKVYVHGKCVDADKCSVLKGLPGRITSPSAINRIILLLNSLHVCAGNPDDHFLQMADSRRGIFFNFNNEPVALVDDFFPISLEGVLYNKTIRSTPVSTW